ncbi:NAD(P)-dependent oxidoreductase [Nonomuraea sediminis]|uniref:NAD(P)-dependent oxidoreductase n=1 Tax=Nonomuraea sediminis TaxID=2835864 RepID=UPI001BDC4B85|nr:NAD(P)H-binding protein [Nonomuraea sediminis]
MNRIAVVGATGRTGRLLVDLARTAGHTVTAIARDPSALSPDLARAPMDALGEVLPGHDAVISAAGAAGRGPTTVYSAVTAALIQAMPAGGRLVVVSSAGLSTPDGAGLLTRLAGRVLHQVMRHTYADMERMESLLAASSLTWTAIRPTGLTDAPATGRTRASVGTSAPVGPRTSRADLAAYILTHLHDPATYHQAVAVSSR